MDGTTSLFGAPIRIVVASLNTGKCLLNTYLSNDTIHVLKTDSLCRLVACVSQIFQESTHNNKNVLSQDTPSFLELDQLWVYVEKLLPQQMFVALVCTPGYTPSHAEIVLSIITNALLRVFENSTIMKTIEQICEKSAKESEKYTANSSMSAKALEPVTIKELLNLENNVLIPLLKKPFEYDIEWYDSFFKSISQVTCFLMRFDFWNQQQQHQLSKHSIYEMQNHRVIHRLNVNKKHALCINVNLGRIINNIKAGEDLFVDVFNDILSATCNETANSQIKVWCVKLIPSPFYLILATDNKILEEELSAEKINIIIKTCKNRIKTMYKDSLVNNKNNVKIMMEKNDLEKEVEVENTTEKKNNRIRIIEVQDDGGNTSANNINKKSDGNDEKKKIIQPKPPPPRKKNINHKSPKNTSIRVSRTTLKEISPEKVEQQLPGIQVKKNSSTINNINANTTNNEKVEVKLMSTAGGSAVGSGARAVAQIKN